MLYISLPNLQPLSQKQVKLSEHARQNKSMFSFHSNQSFQSKDNWLSFNKKLDKHKEEFVEFQFEDDIQQIDNSSTSEDIDLSFKVDSQKLDELSLKLQQVSLQLDQIQTDLYHKEQNLQHIDAIILEYIVICGNQTLQVHSIEDTQ